MINSNTIEIRGNFKSVVLQISVVNDDIAHKLLSTVESSPDISINKNIIIAQLGNKQLTNSIFTILLSTTLKPVPAAINPSIPIERGTKANKIPPSKKDFSILFSFIEKALCQKHWSPKGPDISPIVVGSPKLKNISVPL